MSSATRVAALSLTAVLAAGCATSTPVTQAPSGAPAPSPARTSQPTASVAPPASMEATAEPTAEPVADRWETMATPPCDLPRPTAAALGDGGALVLGCYSEEPGVNGIRWDPADGSWSPAPPLVRPRSSFAMLSLADGRALVVGGFNEHDASYSSVYAFEPLSGTWAKAGVMDTARTNPGVARLTDGRVLVVGGYFWQRPDEGVRGDGVTLAAFHPPAGPGPASRRPVDDVDVPPHGYALATAELYDPETGTFTPTGPMRYARSGPALTTLADGRVLVVGSSRDDITGIDEQAFSTAEIWDPGTGRFTSAGRLPAFDGGDYEEPGRNPVPDEAPAPGSTGSLQPLPDGGALLVAQTHWWKHVGDLSRSFRYDPAEHAWREVGDTFLYVGEPTSDALVTEDVPWLQGVAVFTSPDGRVIRAGGSGPMVRVGNGYTSDPSAAADAYDPGTDAWLPLPPMPAAREWSVPVTVADGSTLLVGGWTPDGDDSSDAMPVRFVPRG